MALIVVCDTNVFVRETHLLRKKGGPALLRLLRAMNGRLLIPEILQTEYVDQTLGAANEQGLKVVSGLSALKTLIGIKYQPLPTDDVIRQGAIDRLRALEAVTEASPLNTEILEAAGRRTMAKRRPTSKTDHGYKDCLIWESVLRLPAGSEVRFVSRDDKAFFNGDQFAQELVEEAKGCGVKVVGYRNLEDLVRDLQNENPTLDLAAREALELAEPGTEAPGELAAAYAASIPKASGGEAVPGDVAPVAADIQAVVDRLVEAQKPFDSLDIKVLAYVAYLSEARKEELFRLLKQAQVPVDAAKNVVERLVLTGFVRDTGHHYLIADRSIGEIVAPTVEGEIIALLERGSNADGH